MASFKQLFTAVQASRFTTQQNTTLCNVVDTYQCFGETYSLCCQGRGDYTWNSVLKTLYKGLQQKLKGQMGNKFLNFSYLGNLNLVTKRTLM